MQILERVRRCKYCASDMTDSVSSDSFAENPLCQQCLPERVGTIAKSPNELTAVKVGEYVMFTSSTRKTI
jgi:hypothetical protein